MKRKIYGLVLLLALVFCIGCNKEKNDTPTPTTAPTATATPSPTPVNLAKENLDKLPAQFDKLMSYQPQSTADLSNGVGYDFTLEVSLGKQIAELLDLADLKSISATGTIDAKDFMAANFDFRLNDDKLLNAHLFADSANLLFNLPDYSANYAAIAWEELFSSATEEATWDSISSHTDGNVISTIKTVDKNTLLSNAEMTALLRKYIVEFTDCFVPVEISKEKVSISNGDYLLAGKKHTIRANISDFYAILKNLETELQNYYEDFTFGLEENDTEATMLFLDYYSSENGDYAWAAYFDNAPAEQGVFISTALGFCLYKTFEDGSSEVLMYSEKTTEKSGTVILPSSEEGEGDLGTIDYEYSDTSFTMQAMLDDVVFTMETSKVNDTIRYDVTVTAEGVSFVIKETVAPTYVDMSCSLASFGMEYLTVSVSADSRSYEEIPVPQNTVDLDTWAAELDQETLLADIITLLQKYPTLMALLMDSDEDFSEDDTFNDDFWYNDSSEEPFTVPEDYTDDFSSMSGYTITDGYVEFFPLESEVLAIGKPSTGIDTIAITEAQKESLLDYAKKTIKNCESDVEPFYWVWGSVESRDVQSYYSKSYTFRDSENWDNSITISFEAVSGEFCDVDIYHEDKETALTIANDIVALLGIDYTVTTEDVENYVFAKNLSFSGYDGYEYGGTYYNVSFSVYYPEW